MLCPKDNIVCDLKQFDYIEVNVCPKCSGVWMEQETIKSLVTHLIIPSLGSVDEQFAAWEVESHQGTLARDFWQEDKIVCSKHNVLLKKHYFGGTNIGVDQCPVCKIFWFDGGELQAVTDMISTDTELDLYNKNKKIKSELSDSVKSIRGSVEVVTEIMARKYPPLIFISTPIALFLETVFNFIDLRNRMKEW